MNKMYLCDFAKFPTKNIKNYNFMNQNKTFDMGGATYETPTITTLEVQAEGVLCGSGDFSIKDWENDGESLDF